jgi:hypothetical protein
VYGLVRSPEKAELVAQRGVSPVLGSLGDTDRLVESAQNADAVIKKRPGFNSSCFGQVLLSLLKDCRR